MVLPKVLAFDFFLFCHRNPGPCPLLDVTEPGQVAAPAAAPGADLRTDVPRYRVYRHGRLVDEPLDARAHWRDDLAGFLLGCSFSFEEALERAGIPVRHRERGTNVPMYVTRRECAPAGVFRGPLVVSMRPVAARRVAEVAGITARFPRSHGAPLHAGDPVPVGPGEVPVFWACGVTPQAVAMAARPELMITHAPGPQVYPSPPSHKGLPGVVGWHPTSPPGWPPSASAWAWRRSGPACACSAGA